MSLSDISRDGKADPAVIKPDQQQKKGSSGLTIARYHGRNGCGHCAARIAVDRDPSQPGRRSWFFAGRAKRSLYDVEILPGDAPVFGKESVGLGPEILESHEENLVAIPTLGAVRSLNLANAVSVALYEALRKNGLLEIGGKTHPRAVHAATLTPASVQASYRVEMA